MGLKFMKIRPSFAARKVCLPACSRSTLKHVKVFKHNPQSFQNKISVPAYRFLLLPIRAVDFPKKDDQAVAWF